MTDYRIEYRFHGYAKQYAKNIIFDVAKRFSVEGVTRNRPVPHITLFGPFAIKNERKMISEVINACKNYDLVPFNVKGFGHFNNPKNKVIYLDIEPSAQLQDLRRDIATRLSKLTSTKEFDRDFDFKFHATVAFKDIDNKFEKIWKYIKKTAEPNIHQHICRVTIIKRQKILCEYDLMQKKLLNRSRALGKSEWSKTIALLKQKTSEYQHDMETTDSLFHKLVKRIKWQFK